MREMPHTTSQTMSRTRRERQEEKDMNSNRPSSPSINSVQRAAIFFAIMLVVGATTHARAAQPAAPEPAVVEYINGVIWTGNPAMATDASVMVTTDGQISYIGNERPPRTEGVLVARVVDLKGQFVVPGLIDNHVHFIDGGAGLAAVQLRDAKTQDEFKRRIVEYADALEAGQWVLFGNWDHEQWGGELPRKEWIDDATPNTPVFVMRTDGHMGFANSAALKLAGIDRNAKQPNGGEIVFDDKGEPTGVLKDTALDPMFAVVPPPSNAERLNSIEAAQRHALSLGLTQVHVMTASPSEADIYSAFVLADQRGLLRIRTIVYTPIQYWREVLQDLGDRRYSSELLSWGGFKGLTDGALGSTTAWFYEPYVDAPNKSGFPLIEAKQLNAMLADAHTADVNTAIHAIGDRAIDVVIATMREVAGANIRDKRYRIEHFQHPSRAAINAAAEYGIVASVQPFHAIDDGRWAEKRIGAERILTTYAFKSIIEAGGILSFGSDWPVAPLSPLMGIHAAVTRATLDGANPEGWVPQEKISVEQALTAYTANNAFTVFEEQEGGTLEVGKRADFVVLEKDLRTVDPDEIANVAIQMTVIDGRVEYEKSQAKP